MVINRVMNYVCAVEQDKHSAAELNVKEIPV